MPESSENGHKKAKQRSPSAPFIDLENAVQRAEQFYRAEGRAAAPPSVAVRHWDYSGSSSGGKQTLAALKAYGLLEKAGDKVRLTERALQIVVPGSPRRRDALREAALEPVQFRALWDRHGRNLPSEDTLKHELVVETGFNPNSVDDFLSNYRTSCRYAGLDSADNMVSELESSTKTEATSGGSGQPHSQRVAFSSASHPSPVPAGSHEVAPLVLPLLDGNAAEFRVLRKIAPEEVEDLEAVFKVWLRKIVHRREDS